MGELRTAARYEAFIRDRVKVNYRPEWHPGDGAPFLGSERFVKKIAKESVPPRISRRTPLKDLLKSVAAKSEVSAEILLRKGRVGRIVNARDRFIRDAVLEQGYPTFSGRLFSQVPSIQRKPGAAEDLVDLGKSDHPAENVKRTMARLRGL